MKRSRREILQMASAALIAAPFVRANQGHPEPMGMADVAALRQQLLQQRNAIRTLHVRYAYTGEPDDPLNGRNELFFDGIRYHYRHHGAFVLFKVAAPGESLTGRIDGAKIRARRAVPTRQWPPEPSLDMFLPVPRDLAILPGEREVIAGEECLALSQGDKRYWVSLESPRVRRLDVLWTADQIRTRQTFSAFKVQSGIDFPTRLNVEVYTREGALHGTATLAVEDVAVNQPVDPALFDIAALQKKSEN